MSKEDIQISRVTRTKEEAKVIYDKFSRLYDLLEKNFQRGAIETALKILDPRQGENILEIGFGTGNSIIKLAHYVGDQGKVFGIDISTRMLDVTRKKLDKIGFSQRVELTSGDAVHMTYAPESFDAIFMSFTLELFDTPEIPILLNECKRALKENGRMCVVAMSRKLTNISVSLYELAHKTFPRYIDCRPILLEDELMQSGSRIFKSRIIKMWGLPVEIVLATKQLM